MRGVYVVDWDSKGVDEGFGEKELLFFVWNVC